MSEMNVVTPPSLAGALALLKEHGDRARPLAGATDVMVRVKEGHGRVPLWVHIRRLPELNGIALRDGRVEIGAAVPFARMLGSGLLRTHAPLLLEAVREIGSVQIRSLGTLGGNLGTASPAGDSLPPLYALDAEVSLLSAAGQRWVPVGEFLVGPGRSLRRPDELIGAVRFAPQQPGERSLWQKLGLRGAQAVSIISLALRLMPGRGPRCFSFARVAYGAVGPTVLRAPRCEALLAGGGPVEPELLAALRAAAMEEVRPISDLRASAGYRRAMAGALLERSLLRLLEAQAGPDASPRVPGGEPHPACGGGADA